MFAVLPLMRISTDAIGALELAVYHRAKLFDTLLLFAGLTIATLVPMPLSRDHPVVVACSVSSVVHVPVMSSLSGHTCSGSDANSVYD